MWFSIIFCYITQNKFPSLWQPSQWETYMKCTMLTLVTLIKLGHRDRTLPYVITKSISIHTPTVTVAFIGAGASIGGSVVTLKTDAHVTGTFPFAETEGKTFRLTGA